MDRQRQDTVVFNVGGRHFEVLRHIIEHRPSTLLATMLDDISYQDDGLPIFVDANPDRFAHVLDWYRYGEMYVDGDFAKQAVLRDARYFLLPDMVKLNGYMHALNSADVDGVFDSMTGPTLAEWPTFYDYVHEKIVQFQKDLEEMRIQDGGWLQDKVCWSSSFVVSDVEWHVHPWGGGEWVDRWVDRGNVCTTLRLQLLLMELRRRGFDCDEKVDGGWRLVRIAMSPQALCLRRQRKQQEIQSVHVAGDGG